MTFIIDLLTPTLIISCFAPYSNSANMYQYQFTCFQNIVFTSSVTDKRTDRQMNGRTDR